MKILVTGHLGEVGAPLCTSLALGDLHQVYTLDDALPAKLDRVIHCAAKHPDATATQLIDSNISFLKDIVELAVAHAADDFIFLSSASVYGNVTMEHIEEYQPTQGDDLYSHTKLVGETYLKTAPLSSLVVRLPGVLEQRHTRSLMSRLRKQLIVGEPIQLVNAHNIFNSFLSPQSFAVFIASLHRFRGYDIVNLAVRPTHSLLEIVEAMHDALHSSSVITVLDRVYPFRSYSIDKAEQIYGFVAPEPIAEIHAWLQASASSQV